jgi:5-methylcytosine-specific restriction enzyme subunit McrC
MNEVIDIFEFKRKNIEDSDLLIKLNSALTQIWKERGKYYDSNAKKKLVENHVQKYAKIDSKNKSITANNYIGTIQFKHKGSVQSVNFLPKIFYEPQGTISETERKNAFLHILWWLSNSEKQFYVSNNLSLDSIPSDFIEAYIFIFSSYALEILSTNAYQYYQTVEEDLETIRGQINFTQYIKNYSKGNPHKISCIYDSFQFDNLFNRIIKYVCLQLTEITNNGKTKQNLEEIIFLLDEVETVPVTVEDCDQVSLNPIYTDLITILDYCRLFLSSLSVYNNDNEHSVLGLLIPTEKLYENLLLSILKNNHISAIKRVGKKSAGRSHLAIRKPENDKKFNLINDIIVELHLTTENQEQFILFDAKYKELTKEVVSDKELSDTEEASENYNILQNDMYQMVSYAISKKVKNIGLFYPLLKNEEDFPDMSYFEVKDEFADNSVIRIFPFKINICHEERLNISSVGKLEATFRKTKEKLISQLNSSVIKIIETQHG